MCCRDICIHHPRRMHWVFSGPVWGYGQGRAEQLLGWKGSWAWPFVLSASGKGCASPARDCGGLLLEERCAKGPRHGAAASHPLQQARLWGGGAGEVRRRLNPLLHRINPCPEFLWLCQPPERKLLTAASLGKGRGVCQGRSLLGAAWGCLKHPCASSANAAPQPTASPAWCRGASSFTAGSGLLFLQPTSTMTPMVPGWSTEPHPAERCRGTVSTCVHNKPTATNYGAPNLPLAEKPHEEEEEDERKC